jgi:hypothetical protein
LALLQLIKPRKYCESNTECCRNYSSRKKKAEPATKRSKSSDTTYPHQRISIEVGERTFRCARRTWTQIETSVVAVAVSLTTPGDQPITLDSFFDEPPHAFEHVVTHLRSNCTNFEPPRDDCDLDAYACTARKLCFERLAAHLRLERVRRDFEREALYLDGQLQRTQMCVDNWKRRTRQVDVKSVILDVDAGDDAHPPAAERLRQLGPALEDMDAYGHARRYAVAAATPLRASGSMNDDAKASSKVCVLLQSERLLRDARDQSHLPSNFTYVARLQEDLIFRRLGLQRVLCRFPLAHRKRSVLVASAHLSRDLYRDLYAYQGHELNESDRADGIEFERPLYGLTGSPEGPAFVRMPQPKPTARQTHPSWQEDDADDQLWFDADLTEQARHDVVTRLLADLDGLG